jgi:HAE1 family hydrophobic/amphiphilic exporter-1
MEFLPKYQRDALALHMLYVRSNSGKLVPLDSVVRPKNQVGSLTVAHLGQSPAVSFSFDMVPGLLGRLLIGCGCPRESPGDHPLVPGHCSCFQSSFSGMGWDGNLVITRVGYFV